MMMAPNQQEMLRVTFSSPSPPHLVIAFTFIKLFGWREKSSIEKEIFDKTLANLVDQIDSECKKRFPSIFDTNSLDSLRQRLSLPLEQTTNNKKIITVYKNLLTQVTGNTTLGAYSIDAGKEHLDRWWRNISTIDLDDVLTAVDAKNGNQASLDILGERYYREIKVYIESHVYNNQDAEDIAQDAWVAVLKNLKNYDHVHGSFLSFAKQRAHYELLRFFKVRKDRAKVHELFSEFSARFPDAEFRDDDTEIIERIAQPHLRENEDAIMRLSLYKNAIRIACGSPNPPHQSIVFGFCKLLEWKPGEVVEELSDIDLRELESRLEEEFHQIVSDQKTLELFESLRARMPLLLKDAGIPPKTLGIYLDLAERVVGGTFLREYYTHKPENTPEAKEYKKKACDDVVRWWNAVFRRLIRELARKRSK